MLIKAVQFCLDNKLIVGLAVLGFLVWGLIHAPFDYLPKSWPKDPVPVDAIPNIGENQQIVFTDWPGRSPQDVEDQITYPLSSALLGIPGVKDIRSTSMFGFSSIYVIFEEEVEFYWSRSRILEKLNALPQGLLPEGVQPSLGPDATALGQIFWYTLEGRDPKGQATGGWSLQELRSIQDFTVKYALASAKGVSEVASVGGYVKEYWVEADVERLRQYDLSLLDLRRAVATSNQDIGAQTLEMNQVEYFIRGLGYIKNIEELEHAVVKTVDNAPILVKDVAKVGWGPATRRGALDKSGAEVAGGVVVARYGANPMGVIENVKEKIRNIQASLPSKVLSDGTPSQLTIVPFYDRTELISETIGTLEEALILEILITVIVVLLLLLHFRSSIMVAGLLPLSVLMCFIAMKYFGIDANIVALSGIAIAIGTMVDMGIVLVESIYHRIEQQGGQEPLRTTILKATEEVGSAVLTAVATTIISFLPVFTMIGAEGKLFSPLAYTKTFALVASIIVTLFILPPLAQVFFKPFGKRGSLLTLSNLALILLGGYSWSQSWSPYWSALVIFIGALGLVAYYLREYKELNTASLEKGLNVFYALWVTFGLARYWMPLGVEASEWVNFFFVLFLVVLFVGFFMLMIRWYESILRVLIRFRYLFLSLIGLILFSGYQSFQKVGEEFMPALDEGAFLLMPTAMPHAGMEENIKNLQLLDMAVTSIPEVQQVVGKLGRVESALDPAPISMYENVITYLPEYKTDDKGRRQRFKIDAAGDFERTAEGHLIPDEEGQYFRNWRPHIQSPDDIWDEIVRLTRLPGVTSAPKLQPIETRLVMLQTGMRAPMGIKVKGQDLRQIEKAGMEIEKILQEVPGVKASAVFAERVVGKPYLNIRLDRKAMSNYGMSITNLQEVIQTAIGGAVVSQTIEGRERYGIRVRYPRELRNDPEAIRNILVKVGPEQHIPLSTVADIEYEQGPQSIKGENGFLVAYVLFDKEEGYSELSVVESARTAIEQARSEGLVNLPPGISYEFAGNYQQQMRANKRLSVALPLALLLIFILLYLQFRSTALSLMVFSGVIVAFAGGFILIGLYNWSGFLDFPLLGANMREVFQIQTIYLSVAVWVGFLALFGIATDDGVLVATFLKDQFRKHEPESLDELEDAVVQGGLRRVRPAMMTTATTLLALLPVLSSTGRGSDVMVPMAIPTFGGMLIQVVTMFTVPILFYMWKRQKIKRS
jgi:Cu(I)/Ag(I) efflux system membrane protein CusA/SilA